MRYPTTKMLLSLFFLTRGLPEVIDNREAFLSLIVVLSITLFDVFDVGCLSLIIQERALNRIFW